MELHISKWWVAYPLFGIPLVPHGREMGEGMPWDVWPWSRILLAGTVGPSSPAQCILCTPSAHVSPLPVQIRATTQKCIASCTDATPPPHSLPLPLLPQVPGIGKVCESTLAALGITTCGQLLPSRGLLAALVTRTSLEFFLHVGLGLGPTRHPPPPAAEDPCRKGISCERTFANINNYQQMDDMVRGKGWRKGWRRDGND